VPRDRTLEYDATEAIGEGSARRYAFEHCNDIHAEPKIDAVGVGDEQPETTGFLRCLRR
jgi:hypothetical protein